MTASSGNRTSSAPASRARAMFSVILATLPSMSPTRVLICARARRSGAIMPLMVMPRPSQNSAKSRSAGSLGSSARRMRRHASAVAGPAPARRARITAWPAAASSASNGPATSSCELDQRGRRLRGVVEDHDVAELERVDELVVGDRPPVARDQARLVRAAGRAGRRSPRPACSGCAAWAQLAGPLAGHLRVVAAARRAGPTAARPRARGRRRRPQGSDPSQARLLVRRDAGRARPLRRPPLAGTPAAVGELGDRGLAGRSRTRRGPPSRRSRRAGRRRSDRRRT